MSETAKPSLLGKLVRGVIGLALMAGVVVSFMYSEKIGRYPWSWNGEDLSGFKDYCLGKFEEIKAGAHDLAVKIKDSKFGEELDALAKNLQGKSEPAPASGTPEAVPPTGETPAPVATTPLPAPTAAPTLSEGEKLFLEGYNLRKKGNREEDEKAQQALFSQAVEVWRKAIPALDKEIEAAESSQNSGRAESLKKIRHTLTTHLHDIFKDQKIF